MKKIKVKPFFGAHQIYQEIANYPPEGVEYVGLSKETSQGKYYESKKFKEAAGRILQKLKLPRMIFLKPGDYDLIHSSRGVIPLNSKPWIMDIEHVFSFTGLYPKILKKKSVKKFVERKLRSEKCKAILCHCEATQKGFFRHLDCSKFKDKIKILYPTSHTIPFKKEKHKKIRILTVLSLFESKGGEQILKAFSKLEKKYKNIELIIKADVPKKIKEKYNSKNIKYKKYFGEIIPREELIKTIYAKADIFIYTTFCDSFGYSLIDGLVAGLPIIGTNLYAVPEVIEDGKNGFVVKIPGYDPNSLKPERLLKNISEKDKEKFVEDLVEKLEILIKNKKLREKMGKESFKLISEGKFSIKERNKTLKDIYKGIVLKN